MRIKKIITSDAVPFHTIIWKGVEILVERLEITGWEIAISSHHGLDWKMCNGQDYYYFREPESKMIMRVTWPKHSNASAPWNHGVTADFMTLEKNTPSIWRKFRSEEELLRDQEVPIVFDTDGQRLGKEDSWAVAKRIAVQQMSISDLLDEIIKRQPTAKRKPKMVAKPTAEIFNFDEYLNKNLIELAI